MPASHRSWRNRSTLRFLGLQPEHKNASPSPKDATIDNVFARQYLQANYDEIYDLVVWLRSVYNGTGRSFFIGDWEMDNKMACSGPCDPLPATIANVIAWENTRQRAVGHAKTATPASSVPVWHYVEINSVQPVRSGSTKPRMINAVLPYISPGLPVLQLLG